MNGKRWPAILAKVFRDIIRNPLSANKDENLSILSADNIKMLDQLGALLKVAADFNELSDVMIRRELHGTNIDLNKVLQEILKGRSQFDHQLDSAEEERTLARRCTSFGHVAENMSVWRSGRIWPIILRIWGSKPISSIRSASSNTR
jgi:hypothetical protein